MSFNVITLPFFDKQLKRLIKKYPSLKGEFLTMVNTLKNAPQTGIFLGDHCYKVKLAIASKGKGKSGGARVITCVQVINEVVYLVSIYDKNEQENIADVELKGLLKIIPK